MDQNWQLYHAGPNRNKSATHYATRRAAMRAAQAIMEQPGDVGDRIHVWRCIGWYFPSCTCWSLTPTGWIEEK